MPVTKIVGCLAFAARNAVSSTPSAATPSSRAGSSTSGVPCSRTAVITVAQETPNARATCATECPSSPTRRHASAAARTVQPARGRICSVVSVQVRTAHAGSTQRHTRLTHTRVTGRPAEGRSRTQLGRRSCNLATTPQPRQKSSAAKVSTACSTSPSFADTANNTKPGKPSIAVAALPS